MGVKFFFSFFSSGISTGINTSYIYICICVYYRDIDA